MRPKQEQITISIPENLRGLTDRIKQIAQDDHRSVSSYVVLLLHNHCLDKEQNN
jgi:hypothetical protein